MNDPSRTTNTSSKRWSDASTEPLDIIIENECNTFSGSLSTQRFRRLANELADLQEFPRHPRSRSGEMTAAARHVKPLRLGDLFADAGGRVWEVFDTRPGGKVDLISNGGALFCTMNMRDVRAMSATGNSGRSNDDVQP